MNIKKGVVMSQFKINMKREVIMKQFKMRFLYLLWMTLFVIGCGAGSGPGAGIDTANSDDQNDGMAHFSVQMGGANSLKAGAFSKTSIIPADVQSVNLEISRGGLVLNTECRNVTPGGTITFENRSVPAGANTDFKGQAFSGQNCAGTILYGGTTSGVTLAQGPNPDVPVNLSLVNATPPTVTTDAATNILGNCADLNGTVNPNSFETVAWFDWGVDTTYGSQTVTVQMGSGTAASALTEKICGLADGTYHYRAVASNGGDMVFGGDQSFAISGGNGNTNVPVSFPGLSTVTTEPASAVTGVSATLHATINPEGAETQGYFEWGLDTTYGNTTAFQALGSGFGDAAIQADLTGLTENTAYHFRAVGFNSFGTTVGADQVFTTPPIVVEPPVECTEGVEPTVIFYRAHTVGCRIDTTSDADSFTFEGTVGDVVRIVVQGVSDGLDPRLEVRDPDGILLHNAICANGCSMVVEPASFTIVPSPSLTKTGTYSILISDDNHNEGGVYGIQLERIPPLVTPQKVLRNTNVTDRIDHIGDVDFFVFDGVAGTDIRITIAAFFDGLDPRLEVYDPDGLPLHNSTCANGCAIVVEPNSFNVTPSTFLPKTGTYLLILSDSNHDEGGSYEINIQCLFGACP